MSPLAEEQRAKLLRAIPSVDALLQHPSILRLTERIDRAVLCDHLRAVLAEVREEILSGTFYDGADALLEEVQERVRQRVFSAERSSLRRVINATGVIIHTNLGRAPLAQHGLRAIEEVARGYSNLEYDLSAGRRGRREVHCEALLTGLLGCETALVVNNNAAAVLLVLNTLAEGGEVIVSRGELVEIGGSFRIPEIMAKSGASLCEVGTTNRTRISDYQRAITERTRILLRVHRSNFRITGFTEQPTLAELIRLGRERGIPCYEDLGSGCLLDLSPWGIEDEPLVQASLATGVDVCSFSGDKLLGGPQAGIIVGRKALIDRLRRNPLMRALRPDKLTTAALEATLRLYCWGRAQLEIPSLHMLSLTVEQLRRRARRLIRRAQPAGGGRLRLQMKPGFSVTGGGAAPGAQIETVLIAVESPSLSAVEVEQRFRAFDPPIISRIEDDEVVLDLRTVHPEEEKVLLAALQSLSAEPSVE